MDKLKNKIVGWLLVIAFVALAVHAYRDYQRGAVSRYLNNSQQIGSLINNLPKGIKLEGRIDTEKYIWKMAPKTQEEFDQIMRAAHRSSRSSVEHFDVMWKDVHYYL